MSVVENIRLLCKQHNTSIPKLEKELGFGNGAIYNWDKNSPSVDKMEKVANYFKVALDELLGRGDLYGIGWMLKKEREEKGITLSQLSDALGLIIDEESLNCYESDEKPLKLGTAALISAKIGIPIEDLLDKYGYFNLSKSAISVNNAPPIWATNKDKRDFKRMLEEDAPVMFDGIPLDEVDKEKIKRVIEAMFWDAKEKNKKSYGEKKPEPSAE